MIGPNMSLRSPTARTWAVVGNGQVTLGQPCQSSSTPIVAFPAPVFALGTDQLGTGVGGHGVLSFRRHVSVLSSTE